VKYFAQRTSGVADFIRRQPYRIGYLNPASAAVTTCSDMLRHVPTAARGGFTVHLNPASAAEVNLPYAAVVNRRGHVTVGNTRSVQAAMDVTATIHFAVNTFSLVPFLQ